MALKRKGYSLSPYESYTNLSDEERREIDAETAKNRLYIRFFIGFGFFWLFDNSNVHAIDVVEGFSPQKLVRNENAGLQATQNSNQGPFAKNTKKSKAESTNIKNTKAESTKIPKSDIVNAAGVGEVRNLAPASIEIPSLAKLSEKMRKADAISAKKFDKIGKAVENGDIIGKGIKYIEGTESRYMRGGGGERVYFTEKGNVRRIIAESNKHNYKQVRSIIKIHYTKF